MPETGVETLLNTNKSPSQKASTTIRSKTTTKMCLMTTMTNLKYGTGPILIGFTTPPTPFKDCLIQLIGNPPREIGREVEKCLSAMMR